MKRLGYVAKEVQQEFECIVLFLLFKLWIVDLEGLVTEDRTVSSCDGVRLGNGTLERRKSHQIRNASHYTLIIRITVTSVVYFALLWGVILRVNVVQRP